MKRFDCFFTYSLSATQIDNDLWLAVVFFKKASHDLLDGMHSKPIASVDERVAADISRTERLIVVRFIAEV